MKMESKIIDFRETENFKRKQNPLETSKEDSISKITREDFNDDQFILFTMKGDSMEPIISEKQKMLFDRILPQHLSENDLQERIIVANVGNKYVIRKFKSDAYSYYLVPENPKYNTTMIPKASIHFRIIGVFIKVLPS
jgi:SOS-response transcriptional repressor LexA